MKKMMKYLAFLAISILLIPSCKGLLDVNEDPTKVSNPPLTVLLPEVELRTSSVHFSLGYTGTQIAHQMDNYHGYYKNISLGSVWINEYLKILNNLNVLIEKAEAENSNYYSGIGKILKAQNLGILTDVYEDIPYTEAFKGSLNINPKYDKQELIYNEVFDLLDAGIRDLETGESFREPKSDDMFYGGDIEKWLMAAHSLKAKYLMHLSNKANVDWAKIADEANKGILKNANNMTLTYDEANPNPWYSSVAIGYETANLSLTPSKMLVDKMNTADGGPLDPRMPIMFVLKTDTTVNYVGSVSWDADAPSNTVDLRPASWFGKKATPMLMFTAAENYFILAEALTHTGGDVKQAFDAGIDLNMSMLGVDVNDRSTYITAIDDGAIEIDDIMKQKFIALYLNGEVWTDMRRHHFDVNIFDGLVVPDDSDGRLGAPGQRSRYPDSETTRNGDNVPVVDLIEPMWRDK